MRGADASVASKMTGGSKDELEGWSTQQVNLFLEFLLSHADEEKPFTETALLALDKAYSFTKSGNAEIRFRWQSLCLHSDVAWIGECSSTAACLCVSRYRPYASHDYRVVDRLVLRTRTYGTYWGTPVHVPHHMLIHIRPFLSHAPLQHPAIHPTQSPRWWPSSPCRAA